MRNRTNRLHQTKKRNQAYSWTRAAVFTLVFATCAVAVVLGSLPPSAVTSGATAAAQTATQRGGNARPGAGRQAGEQISESARQQIAALMQEKATRSPGRKKMDSRLIYAIKMRRGEQIAPGVPVLDVSLPRNARGEAIIDITANVSPRLLSALRKAGAKIISSFPRYRTIRVEVSLDAVDAIADLPGVIFVQPEQEAVVWREGAPLGGGSDSVAKPAATTRPGFEERARNVKEHLAAAFQDYQLNAYNVNATGVRKSEADTTQRAAVARNTYGFDGTGIKIGILSDGVRNLAAAQASGDVGPVTVLPGQSGTSAGQCGATTRCDEGTAMLELVHDLAPGAQLFFATAFGTPANFATNINALRAAGCDIIIDDVFYFVESPFQDGQAPGVISPNNQGVVTQAVNDVTAAGALYFSSAGNSGNENDGTSSVWEGDFVDGGATAAPLGAGQLHLFPADGAIPARTFNTNAAAGGPFILNWADPMGASSNDYDLYILNAAGTAVAIASTNEQDGNDDPIELLNVTANVAGLRLVIVKEDGDPRFLRLSGGTARLTVNTPGQTSGHSCAAEAFGVAATPAGGAFPNAHDSGDVVETFSSDGPRKLFFQPDGTPYTPGNVLASGGINRQKPDITATDGASVTGAGGFPFTFFGTSAAAPHAGAIAALLKSSNPSLTPAQIRTALQGTAIDIETPGVDRDAGHGIVMADAAMASLGLTATAANVSLNAVTVDDVGGNGNDFIEPGERGTLDLQLLNTGNAAATGVTATLSTTTPNVFITPPATRSYPDVAATSGTATSAAPFEFVLQEGAAYATQIEFVLTVTYNGTATRTFPFFVLTGRMANISSTLDTTPPTTPSPTPDSTLATTGTQTGRVNFTIPNSSCGSAKANPGTTSTLARRYDAYSFTNTSASTICVTVAFNTPNSVLLHAVAYVPAFVPATPSLNYAADGGGSTTNGAGTAQLFSFNVPALSTFTVVVSESNSGGAGAGVPYNLRVSGLPAEAVPANQPPVNTVPGAQTTDEDTPLVFSAGNSNAISVSDPDAGNNPVQVTLNAANGTLTLDGTTGLTFSSGDGMSDSNMVFTGSIPDINAALDGMSFTPSQDYFGPASVQITTNDQGFTGTGGPQSDSDTVNITVNDVPPGISVRDATRSEPPSGQANMLFTVALSETSANTVSVRFDTQAEPAGPGKAVGGASCAPGVDYVNTAAILSFPPGSRILTVPVPVCADGLAEPDETFLGVLSLPSGGTIADGTATGTITANAVAGTILISELRTFGPTGATQAGDDFVEIYNNSDSPHTVADGTGLLDAQHGYGLFRMGADCGQAPVLVGVIPNGTVIPARGHYLFVGSQYSLGSSAAGDQTMTSDLANNSNVGLFSRTDVASLSTTTRLDAVGFDSNGDGNCALLREDNALPAVNPAEAGLSQHSYYRSYCSFVEGAGCTTPNPGFPADRNDNAADFIFVDTNATPAAGLSRRRLGAPGPEGSTSPRVTDNVATFLVDANKSSSVNPNRVRRQCGQGAEECLPNRSQFGTMAIRRRFTNNTGGAVTQLRFRIVEVTTIPRANASMADMRAIPSVSVTTTGLFVTDPATCAATGTPTTAPCDVTIQGTTVEGPPQPIGGGYNTTMGVTIPSLANGASVNVQFMLGVQQTGNYRFLINVEALP